MLDASSVSATKSDNGGREPVRESRIEIQGRRSRRAGV